jgi:LacI family transcriptional regulator
MLRAAKGCPPFPSTLLSVAAPRRNCGSWGCKSQAPSQPLPVSCTLWIMLKKLRDFAATLATSAPYLTLLPAIGGHELQKNLTRLRSRFSVANRIRQGSTSIPPTACRSCRRLRKNQLLRKIQVVTTDLFPEQVPLIEAGKILATIYQRPFTRGRIALETLLWFLTKKIEPVSTIKLAPHLVLRSNLTLFTSHLSGLDDTELSISSRSQTYSG